MQEVYYNESAPDTLEHSIFLAGPTPRSKDVKSWRGEALAILEAMGYKGVVFLPEYRGNSVFRPEDWKTNVVWETNNLQMADVILFWVPRNLKDTHGLTTNDEWGTWKFSGKAVFGAPDSAERITYQRYFAEEIVGLPRLNTLPATIEYVLKNKTNYVERTGAERKIPADIFVKPEFTTWYKNQLLNGNSLVDALVEWTFYVGNKKQFLFSWIIHVDVYIASEDRNKSNEFIFGRPDVATIILYSKQENPKNVRDIKIGLVREFRSPVNNKLGMVYEPPGGSAFNTTETMERIALHELQEETGLNLPRYRLKYISTRQLMSTLSVHRSHLYAVCLTEEEFRTLEQDKGPHGVVEDTERTYIEIVTLGDILDNDSICDFAAVGMIANAVLKV